MTTWTISLNGKAYSNTVSKLRSQKHAPNILEQWKTRTTQMGYSLPDGELRATTYTTNKLDSYGVNRGG